MKQNKKIDWKALREEILTTPNWIVNLEANDVDTIADADDESVVIAEAIDDCDSENRFPIISKSIFDQLSMVDFSSQSNISMLLYFQFPLSSPIMMTEMSFVNELLDKMIPKDTDCEIKWAMSPREDKVSRIVCAFKKNNCEYCP